VSNTARLQTRPFLSRAVAGLVLLALSTACDSPTQPSPNRPEPNRTDPRGTDTGLSGTYTMTLSASSRCPLEVPEAMRSRTYTATIAQGGGSLVVTLQSIFPPWDNRTFGTDNRFTGVLGGNNDVVFQVQFEEWLVEGPEGLFFDFYAYGRMTTTISPSGLSGFWDGFMRWNVGNRSTTCTAPDQGVVFSRRPQ
jgi:hypothetical protein